MTMATSDVKVFCQKSILKVVCEVFSWRVKMIVWSVCSYRGNSVESVRELLPPFKALFPG